MAELSELVQSSFLRRQVDELISTNSSKKLKNDSSIIVWLDELQKFIKTCASKKKNGAIDASVFSDEMLLHDSSMVLQDIKPPDSVVLCGSHVQRTQTKPFLNIDLLVVLPEEMFEKRDTLNHIYFDKRKLYLGMLCKKLRVSKLVDEKSSVSYAFLKEDSRKPILLVRTPTKAGSKSRTVRLIPVAPATAFRVAGLRCNKCNLRPFGKNDGSTLTPSFPDSPDYNCAVLEDVALLQQHEIISAVNESCESFAKTVILFKIWLHQKGLRWLKDSIDGHSCSLLVAYLYQTRSISPTAHPLHAFQVLVRFLAETNLSMSILDFTVAELRSRNSSQSCGDAAAMLTHPVFGATNKDVVDMNIFWRLSHSAIQELQNEAKLSLSFLQTDADTCFHPVFVRRRSIFSRHDIYYFVAHANPDSNLSSSPLKRRKFEKKCENEFECLESWKTNQANQMHVLVSKALGGRALSSRFMEVSCAEHFVPLHERTSSHPSLASSYLPADVLLSSAGVLIGLSLDNDASASIVDKGPSADNSSKVAEFLDLWGEEKAGIRRFRDGSICYAVVWDEVGNTDMTKGECIVDQCMRHMIHKHFGGPQDTSLRSVIRLAGYLNHILPYESETVGGSIAYRASSMASKAFDNFRGMLINNLTISPFIIEGVNATTPHLRFTSLAPPKPNPVLSDDIQYSGKSISLVIAPLNITLAVASASAWPSDSDAVEKLRTAILLLLSDEIRTQLKLKTTAHMHCLDVVFKGYIFRLHLSKSTGLDQLSRQTSQIVPMSSILKPEVSLHHSAVLGLHFKCPTFGEAVRLLRCWVSSNFFSSNISHETLELIVASGYLDCSAGEKPPTSSTAGFDRALECLAHFDWENIPLIVDFKGTMTTADRSSITKAFQESRRLKKRQFALFAVSSENRESSTTQWIPTWGKLHPEKVVLRLITAQAAASRAQLMARAPARLVSTFGEAASVNSAPDESHLALFDHASASIPQKFDVVLHFNKALLCSSKRPLEDKASGKVAVNPYRMRWEQIERGPPCARKSLFANLSSKKKAAGSDESQVDNEGLICLDGDSPFAVQERIMQLLRARFDSFALFFWNDISGKVLGVVWRPQKFLPAKFSVMATSHRVLCQSNEKFSCTVPNTAEIVAEMIALADGCIERAEFR